MKLDTETAEKIQVLVTDVQETIKEQQLNQKISEREYQIAAKVLDLITTVTRKLTE